MPVPASDTWKLALGVALTAAILLGACGAAPRRAVAFVDLRRLVASALGLYIVGGIASLTHHPVLAALVYAAGISICALALWLSRGTDSDEGPPGGGEQPTDERPPPEPDGLTEFDWTVFEHEFRAYSQSGDPPREPAVR
jgi:hypothetical protein